MFIEFDVMILKKVTVGFLYGAGAETLILVTGALLRERERDIET